MMRAGRPASAVQRLIVVVAVVTMMAACGPDGSSRLPRADPDSSETTGENTTPATDAGGVTLPLPVTPAPDNGVTIPASPDQPTVPVPATEGIRAPVLFDRLVYQDPMAANVDAIVLLVPQGWQAQASVQWLPEWSRTAFLQTQVADPVTGVTIDWLPTQDFIWFPSPDGFNAPIGGNYQGKQYQPPIFDPGEFVANFWMPSTLPHLQGATLVDVQQVQPIADEFKNQFGGPADAFAYKMRYEFVQNGQIWEEDVSFALLYAGNADLTSWYVNFAYTVRAPQGELDRNQGLISTIVASRTSTPQWEATYRVVQQLFTQGIRQQMADTVAFGKALAAYNAEIFALQQQVTAERQASQDRIADLRGETLSGVQTYTDPVNGTMVQLPVGWNDYWVNDQGEYLTSDQPGFDPNSLGLGTWEQLIPRA
jgi:hypothetical protein